MVRWQPAIDDNGGLGPLKSTTRTADRPDQSRYVARHLQTILSSDADRQDMIAYWMSGYFRASRSQPIFDFQRFANNKKAVTNYCKKRGSETVMSAIQNSAR